MGDRSPISAAEVNASVAAIAGKRISRVCYFSLSYETTEPVEWDFGDWHWPEHGVEFTLEDGTTYSASWGDAFGCHDLELLEEPMSTRLHGVGDPDGPRVWEVTRHRLWMTRVGQPVTDARIIWIPSDPSDEDPSEERQAPIALWLSFPAGDVWIVAAEPVDRPPADRFYLGQNEVVVGFTPAFAAAVGLPVAPSSDSGGASDL